MDLPIKIFYHMYCINDCFDRFIRSYDKITDSGLLNRCDQIHLVLVGPNKDQIYNSVSHLYKVSVIKKDDDSSEKETLNLLWQMSQTEMFYGLYLHSKGVTHIDKDNCYAEHVNDWVEYLEYFCITNYKDCLIKIKEGNTCGVEIRKTPFFHYCGNIWWANSEYIKNIDSPNKFIFNQMDKSYMPDLNLPENIQKIKKNESERWLLEFWITHSENITPITLNQSYLHFNFYQFKFPKKYYKIDPCLWPYKLSDYVSAWKGLENYILPIINNFGIKTDTMLEFGVDYGYSTDIFSKVFKKVIGVDSFISDPYLGHDQGDIFYKNIKEQFKGSNIELCRSSYQDFIKDNNNRYDLIHIDIIHTYKETYECAEWAIMHSNVVLLHDTYSFPEMHRVCRDLSLKHKWGFINIKECHGLGVLYKQY
jgi:hypothetical protein